MKETEVDFIARKFLEDSYASEDLELLAVGLDTKTGRGLVRGTRQWLVRYRRLNMPVMLENDEVWVEVDDMSGKARLFPML